MGITDAASFYSYCRTSDNIWSQPVCAGNSYGNSIGQLKIAYCRSNPTDSRCTNYCTSQDAARTACKACAHQCTQGQTFNSPACQNICTASTGTDPWGYKGNCNQVYANACARDQSKIWTCKCYTLTPGGFSHHEMLHRVESCGSCGEGANCFTAALCCVSALFLDCCCDMVEVVAVSSCY